MKFGRWYIIIKDRVLLLWPSLVLKRLGGWDTSGQPVVMTTDEEKHYLEATTFSATQDGRKLLLIFRSSYQPLDIYDYMTRAHSYDKNRTLILLHRAEHLGILTSTLGTYRLRG